MQRLLVEHLWNGSPARPGEAAAVTIERSQRGVVVEVFAPDHGDAPPDAPPGPIDRLWEHEVVEVFLADAAARYLEIELGPHGHHLVILLDGIRRPVRSRIPIDYRVRRNDGHWHGRAEIDAALLPRSVCRVNAYAIHGTGAERRWLAAAPVPGSAPDFHRLDCFVPLTL